MKTAEMEYVAANTDNNAEMAYAVNNNQMSVNDLPSGFDSSLLNGEKKTAYDELGKTETATETNAETATETNAETATETDTETATETDTEAKAETKTKKK